MHYEYFEYQQYIKFHNEMCYKMLAVNPPQELWLSSNLIFTVLAHYFGFQAHKLNFHQLKMKANLKQGQCPI